MLSTPNVANWTMRLSLLGGRWRYTERGILDRTHLHLFTRKSLVEMLDRAGYRVVELDFTVPVPMVGTPGSSASRTRLGGYAPAARVPVPGRGRAEMISVVIPVKNGGTDLVRCLEAIAAQQIGDEVEVVVVDSGSSDGSAETAQRLGARVHSIAPTEFHHGRTRNLGAELARGDILVFTSQDAHAADEHWLANLTSPLAGENVAGAYGRQLPHRDARPPERYFLDFLYGPRGTDSAPRGYGRAQLRG